MILDELVLHDFGVYGGRQSLVLTPAEAGRPIVLIGGLNGGGKTTLLEAIQLCLFGSAAPAADRAPGGYEEHLRRRIHRGAGVREAGVELAFRHTSNGTEHSYRVIRSWAISGSGACRESFEVLRDGRLDRLATDNWPEQVEEFMPTRIASLFLFDGEKVENYADPEEAPALIATAVHNLLGLDIVERLSTDLSALERRKRAERQAPAQASPADGARAALAARREARIEFQRVVAENNDALDRATRDLKIADDRFRREGGDLYERRAELEASAIAARRRALETERDVREFAAGTAPLLMVADLLVSVRDRDRVERETVRSAEMASALRDEHVELLNLPIVRSLPEATRVELTATLEGRRAGHAERGAREVHLALPADARLVLEGLAAGELDSVRHSAKSVVQRAQEAGRSVHEADRALAAIPNAGELEALSVERARLQDEVARLCRTLSSAEEALAAADRDIAVLREREAKLAEAEALDRFRSEDAERVLVHSARVRSTLLKFRDAVIARQVTRIEQLVLESFKRLVRKPDLVTALRIDANAFTVELTGSDGQPILPGQLSAGERQLLAVAILWGLAKASGRPLPTVIDTPLGRLDSHHRARLVERYFPHASHQVILLSTDEEIAGGYHEALEPWIGRSYHLAFDEEEKRTVIEQGYLERGEMRSVA